MVPFCFVIHPLSFEDVIRYEPGAAGKGKPIVAKILEWMPAYAAAHLTGIRTPDGRETEGWFVAAPLLPAQMLSFPRDEVYARILRGHRRSAPSSVRGSRGSARSPAVVGDGGVTIARALADSGDHRQLADDRGRRAQPLSRAGRDGHRRGGRRRGGGRGATGSIGSRMRAS